MSAGLVIEPARYAVTGGQPCGAWGVVRPGFAADEVSPLDAPDYLPCGSVHIARADDRFAVTSVLREGVLA